MLAWPTRLSRTLVEYSNLQFRSLSSYISSYFASISVGYQSRKIAAGNDSALCLKFLYAHFDGRATVYTQHGRSLGKVSVKIVERTHIT